MSDKVAVIPTFRLGIDGKLFKCKESNKDPQETIMFHTLFTRLALNKGELPLFPDLGLKQHLHKFNFNNESSIAQEISEFELDVESQLGRSCTINYEIDKDNKNVNLSFELDGLEHSFDVSYSGFNGSIRPINYQFDD